MPPRKWPVTIRDHEPSTNGSARPNGFILLEVLVAMSLIMGSWMTATHSYQKLALILLQQERKRSQLRSELDAYEIASVKNDATRVSGRNHTLRTSTKPAIKGQRTFSSETNGI